MSNEEEKRHSCAMWPSCCWVCPYRRYCDKKGDLKAISCNHVKLKFVRELSIGIPGTGVKKKYIYECQRCGKKIEKDKLID